MLVFDITAIGDAAPVRTIAGANTGLGLPIGIAVDHRNNIFVADRTQSVVAVFATNANGNVAPVSTLTATNMLSPEGLALGPNEDVYASTCPGCGESAGGDVAIFHFPAGSMTSDFSIDGADTGLSDPDSITVDANHDLFVSNAFGGLVSIYAQGATGDTAPTSSFTPAGGPNIQGLAHGTSTIAITDPSDGVALYDASSVGNATPAATIASSAQFPLVYPGGIFFDETVSPPDLYVVDYSGNALYVLHTAGTEPALALASVTTISGPTTGLASPLQIAVVH